MNELLALNDEFGAQLEVYERVASIASRIHRYQSSASPERRHVLEAHGGRLSFGYIQDVAASSVPACTQAKRSDDMCGATRDRLNLEFGNDDGSAGARSSSSMDALEAGANEEQNLLCAVDPSLGMSRQQVQAHGQLVDALHSREEILGAASG